MYTRTVSARQIAQILSALQILVEGDLLSEEEKGAAGSLSQTLKRVRVGDQRLPGGEPYATVYLKEEEDKLLDNVFEALWGGRGSDA